MENEAPFSQIAEEAIGDSVLTVSMGGREGGREGEGERGGGRGGGGRPKGEGGGGGGGGGRGSRGRGRRGREEGIEERKQTIIQFHVNYSAHHE